MTLAQAIEPDEITYRVETPEWMLAFFSDIPATPERRQVERLIKEHQDEIVVHKHLQKLDPDWARYRELTSLNRIFMVMARRGDEIVGYIVLFVQRHLHDRKLRYSMDDLYYVERTERAVGIGRSMIACAEAEARRRGSRVNLLRAKIGSPTGKFLEMIGYRPFEMVWSQGSFATWAVVTVEVMAVVATVKAKAMTVAGAMALAHLVMGQQSLPQAWRVLRLETLVRLMPAVPVLPQQVAD